MNFFFKFLTFIYATISFLQRKIFIKNISKNDIVLDIGSGDKPFWRSDIIIDKYINDDQQRHSGAMQYDKRKVFLQADVENLPFKNKVFDFAFCSHLLEHVENPDKAIDEIIRVSKRGYIEVPNGIVDLFKPFPPHLWFCNYKDGILFFRQKEKENNFLMEITQQFGNKFFDNAITQYFFAKNFKSIFITIYWNNILKYKVERVRNPYKYVYKEELHKKTFFTKISFFLYKIFYILVTGLFYKKKEVDINNFLLKNK